jgi:hypothetical protein
LAILARPPERPPLLVTKPALCGDRLQPEFAAIRRNRDESSDNTPPRCRSEARGAAAGASPLLDLGPAQRGRLCCPPTHAGIGCEFRHTLGTRMINNEVSLYVVQRMLDHGSPEMTARYATIKDQTLRKWERFQQRINLHGELMPLRRPR